MANTEVTVATERGELRCERQKTGTRPVGLSWNLWRRFHSWPASPARQHALHPLDHRVHRLRACVVPAVATTQNTPLNLSLMAWPSASHSATPACAARPGPRPRVPHAWHPWSSSWPGRCLLPGCSSSTSPSPSLVEAKPSGSTWRSTCVPSAAGRGRNNQKAGEGQLNESEMKV